MIEKTNTNQKEYTILARKYRPKLFSELIGQETLVETLTNAIKLNRVSHAYLLTGVRGVGKTTTARLIARALNCESLEKNLYEPCGVCDSCKSIIEERNMDIIEMDAASQTGVENIRSIIDNVKYKPSSSKYKIYIIDEVHMLSISSFNALLKTLEEPPPHVKFLFATTVVRKIPITILSRCQRFDLHRINNEKLIDHLQYIAKKENIQITKDALALIVRAADGSVRDGLSLLDQAITNTQEKIDINKLIKIMGLADRGKIFDLLDHIFKGEAENSLILYKNLYDQGADSVMIFDEMLQITHFITQIKILPSILESSYIPELEKTKGSEMAKKLNMSSLGMFWQVLFRGYQELLVTKHIYQTSEMIILRLIYLSNTPPPADLIKKIENQDQKDNSNEIMTNNLSKNNLNNFETTQKNKEENIIENNSNIIKKIYSFRELVELFHKYREGVIYTQLYNNVKLISFEEGKIVINLNGIKNPDFIKKVTKLISKWTGRIWTVNISESNIGKTLSEEDIIIKQKELEIIKNDPSVKKILQDFPGSTIHSVEKLDSSEDNYDNNKDAKPLKLGE
tara:strand:- start:105 stop:1811 length:1707 start_codon:yes stop_codon:yes gene_type:complete